MTYSSNNSRFTTLLQCSFFHLRWEHSLESIGFRKKSKLASKLASKTVFVHDGINSVADYNLLRVGVGCRMYVVCLSAHISWLDNFWTPWDIELKFCMVPYLDDLLGKWADRKNRTTPTTPTTLPPYQPHAIG